MKRRRARLPAQMSSARTCSAGEWLTPPVHLKKSMPTCNSKPLLRNHCTLNDQMKYVQCKIPCVEIRTWVRRDMAMASWPAPLTNDGAIIPPSSKAETLFRNGGKSFIAMTAAEFSISLNFGAQATAPASCCTCPGMM